MEKQCTVLGVKSKLSILQFRIWHIIRNLATISQIAITSATHSALRSQFSYQTTKPYWIISVLSNKWILIAYLGIFFLSILTPLITILLIFTLGFFDRISPSSKINLIQFQICTKLLYTTIIQTLINLIVYTMTIFMTASIYLWYLDSFLGYH